MERNCPIAIVGGGLAGLGAAHALKAFGFQAEVFEAAPALGEIGAAVNTSPNATKALQAIGLGEKIAAVANLSPGIFTRNMQTGEPLEFNDRRKAAAPLWRAPLYFPPRRPPGRAGEQPRSRVDPSRPPPRCASRSAALRVTLTFANGTTFEADIVIGADGVRSVIRHALYGDDNPTYTGQMVWRALAQRQRRAARGAGAQRACPMGRARLPFHRLLHSRHASS